MDEQEKRDEYKLRRERIVRWDKYRINQFSYTNNLFIGLNSGFLAFFISQSDLTLRPCLILIDVYLLAILALIISFFTGIATTLNRLYDFRETAQLTKERKKNFEHRHNIIQHCNIDKIRQKISHLELETKKIGNKTWILLKWQIWTFVIGTILGILYLIIEKNTSQMRL